MARQRRDLDSPWKETLQVFLRPVLTFFFPRLAEAIDWERGYVALDKEFQQIVRDARAGRRLADKLFRVWLRNGKEKWILVHVEVQGGVEAGFARRMFEYNYRCYELYRRRVISLAILCDNRPNWRPDRFYYGGWGSRTGIRFPMVKLLDYADKQAELERDANPIAQVVLAHLKAMETRRDPASRQEWKIRLVKGLYRQGWSADDVRQLFRVIDWLLELPAELQTGFREELYRYEEEQRMPYLSSIERDALAKGLEEGKREGKQEGRREGKQEGRREGQREGERKGLLLALRANLRIKFGAAGLKLWPKIKAIPDNTRLRALTKVVAAARKVDAVRERLS